MESDNLKADVNSSNGTRQVVFTFLTYGVGWVLFVRKEEGRESTQNHPVQYQ